MLIYPVHSSIVHIAKKGEQPNCLSINESINKMCIHRILLCLKKEILKLGDIVLSG